MNKGNFFATLKLYLVSRCLAELSAVDVGATGKFYFKVDVYKECTSKFLEIFFGVNDNS